jgi:hypothetical protein
MRAHLSITIAGDTAQRLRVYARRERRPVSQVVEMAVERLLDERAPVSDRVVTTSGSFSGRFSRAETHADR